MSKREILEHNISTMSEPVVDALYAVWEVSFDNMEIPNEETIAAMNETEHLTFDTVDDLRKYIEETLYDDEED
jgi:fructose-1,6-bisphosphatase